jgi:hypothetical protein
VESSNHKNRVYGALTLRDSHKTYFGTSTIEDRGAHGELKKIAVNHYANLIRHLLVMVTAQRPAWEPRAANSDHKSQAQTVLASGLLDHYMREKRLERLLKKATEYALYQREGWISATWDVTSGEVYAIDPESNGEVREGDIQYKVHTLLNVIRDPARKSIDDLPWLIVREQKNKYDLAAKYREMSARILDVQSDSEVINEISWSGNVTNDDDSLQLYTFYHEKSASVPNGRMVEFLKDGTVLFDGPLPYRKVPVFKITSSDLDNSPFGHSQAFDLLPVQKAINSEFSTVITNHDAFGVQNLAVPKGSGVSVTQVTGGLNLIEYDSKLGPPSALNLVQTPAEIFNSINLLTSTAETLSGVNSVARGNAPASLSGAAMALIQSTSLQFSSGLQASYVALLEDVGTATIQLLQDFAQVPRIAALVGKHNRTLLKEFKGEDIAQISRVTVDSANPLTKSTAGRVEIANQLLNSGMIKRPEQYLMVIQTGQLEAMLESDTSQLLRVRAENEKLANGQQVQAIISDDHSLDIREHLSILDSPESREAPEIVQLVLSHVFEHIELAKSMPPELMQILGRQPLGPPPMQPQQGVQVETLAQPVDPGSNVPMPSMPKIAGTNETFDPNNVALPVGGQ